MKEYLLNLQNGVTINMYHVVSIDKDNNDGNTIIRMDDGSLIPVKKKYQHFLDDIIPNRHFIYDEKTTE